MFRLLGRDPITEPMTDLELELFYRTTLEHVEVEFKARAGDITGDMTSD